MNETAIERPRFLMDLLAEVDGFDSELFKPDVPVSAEDEEVVVGELSPWCQKAYALTRHLNRQGRMLCAEREHESVEDLSQDAEVLELRYKASVVNEIIFATTRFELGLFTTPCMGIREGWKVVSTPEDSQDDPFKSLMAILKKLKKG